MEVPQPIQLQEGAKKNDKAWGCPLCATAPTIHFNMRQHIMTHAKETPLWVLVLFPSIKSFKSDRIRWFAKALAPYAVKFSVESMTWNVIFHSSTTDGLRQALKCGVSFNPLELRNPLNIASQVKVFWLFSCRTILHALCEQQEPSNRRVKKFLKASWFDTYEPWSVL